MTPYKTPFTPTAESRGPHNPDTVDGSAPSIPCPFSG